MSLFDSIFGGTSEAIDPMAFLLSVGCALVLGLALAAVYRFRSKHSDSLMFTIALIPAVVSVIIMVVNGNIGAGIAVMGAFSLVRFRSAPGTAKEIVMIFLAMSTGLLVGMGFLAYGALFTAIMCAICVAYNLISKGWSEQSNMTLRITVPEDLDYRGEFDGILSSYTTAYELQSVKTTNMGSMFRLTYGVTLSDGCDEKRMIDEIRCKNGNLEVYLGHAEQKYTEL